MTTFDITPKALKTLVALGKACSLAEMGLRIEKDRIVLCAVDPAHVMMVDSWLPILNGPEEPQEVLVRYGSLEEAAKVFSGEIRVEVTRSAIHFKEGRKRRTIPIMADGQIARPKAPNVQYEHTFKLPTGFIEACIKASPFDTDGPVLFSIVDGPNKERLFNWSAKTQTGDEFEDSVQIPDSIPSGIRSYFSYNFLTDILGPVDSKELSVSLKTDYPMKLEYPLEGGAGVILLAPRIEED